MPETLLKNNQLENELMLFVAEFDIEDPAKEDSISEALWSMFKVCHKYFDSIPFDTINNTWNKVVGTWDIRLKNLLQKYAQFNIEKAKFN